VVACCLILAVEAPLVIASLGEDLKGAYPAWESAEVIDAQPILEVLLEEPVLEIGDELEPLEEQASLEPELLGPLADGDDQRLLSLGK
jgi:hypothetical protein